MSFSAFLNQTCTITRDTASGTDRYNNAEKVPMTVVSDVRCRKTQKAMRMLDPNTGEYATVHADLVLMPIGTPVLPGDELLIGSQVWQAGQVLTRQRMNSQHHISVLVEALSG